MDFSNTKKDLENLTNKEYNEYWDKQRKEWTKKISIPPDTKFCPLLKYNHSNCNGRKYTDKNCFESKMPGCKDGKIYLALRKYLPKNPSLHISSKLSKIIDYFKPRA